MVEWEIINENSTDKTQRMKVPGGWIVQTISCVVGWTDNSNPAIGMVFVPNPEGDWDPKPKPSFNVGDQVMIEGVCPGCDEDYPKCPECKQEPAEILEIIRKLFGVKYIVKRESGKVCEIYEGGLRAIQ